MRSRRVPKYDVHRVTDMFQDWLLRGDCRNDSPIGSAPRGPFKGFDFLREDLQLYLVAAGVPQVMWFSSALDISKVDPEEAIKSFSFHVLSPNLKLGSDPNRIANEIRSRASGLTYDEKKIRDQIFGEMGFREHSVPFRDELYNGLCVDVKINSLPLGRNGRLSENLFKYAERGIARPLRGLAYDKKGRTSI